jgi:glycerophosphoryl diester phosphodiesterase
MDNLFSAKEGRKLCCWLSAGNLKCARIFLSVFILRYKFYLRHMMGRIKIFLFVMMSSTLLAQNIPKFDIQGHRGARGLMPENTIPAFLLALDSNVTTIEMDLAITKDKQVIVSHEPWMSAEFCLNPDGISFSKKDEKKFNIYQMSYEQVKQWDCGSKPHERFLGQKKMIVIKPLLSEVIVAVENHIKNFTKYEVDYTIEIKSEPEGDNKFHPKPDKFSDMVYELIDQYLPLDRVVIQSFDFRVLKYWHKKYPEVRLAALVENKKPIEQNLTELGFVPSVYSPNFKLLTKDTVELLHTKNVELTEKQKEEKISPRLRVIPWTVNEPIEMLSVKGMGVDGFITDYPDRAAKFKRTLNISAGKK